MPRSKEYNLPLDSVKVEALSKVWDTEDPVLMLQNLFDMVYRSYVVDDDALMSVKAHRKQIDELRQKVDQLNRTIEEYKQKLVEKQRLEKEVRLCPACQNRVKYDAIREEFECKNCGWRGETDQTILEVE